MRVDFFIIGAAKCGTSTLAGILGVHPEISFCKVKEPFFFNYPVSTDMHQISAYHQLFIEKPGAKYGEASTLYSCYPEYSQTEKRIYNYNPGAKIIYLMRHPVNRIRSHYWHNMINKRTLYDKSKMFDEIQLDPTYLLRSRYGMQLEQYFSVFPKQNILMVFLENLISQPESALRDIYTFLKVSPLPVELFNPLRQYRNKSSERLSAGLLYRLLGKTDLNKLIPLRLKHKLFYLTANAVPPPLAFSSEQEKWILKQLSADLNRLCSYTGIDVYKLWEIPDKY
jgi:hypothetical protein